MDYRLRVIGGCIVGMIIAAIVFNDLFSISHVSMKCVMLFVLFAIATEPFMRYLTMLFTYLESKVQNRFNGVKLKKS